MDTARAGQNPNKVDTPPKPKPQPKNSSSDEPSIFGSNASEFFQFLRETWQEFRKISWPNREQVIKETGRVLVLVALITCSVLAFDWVIAKSIFEPLDKYARKHGGGVGSAAPWTPLQPTPGTPVNNPSAPGNAPASPASPAPASSSQPASPAPVSAPTSTPGAPLSPKQ